MSDAISVFTWWLAIQVLGLAVWPLAARWLRWLPDRGYMLAKPIGLLFVSYGLWLLATLGVIQNSTGGLIAVLIGLAAISVVVYRRYHATAGSAHLRSWLRDHRMLVIAYETLFVIALIGWAVFRANNPDLGSTEKPMEFAFFNAINRSVQFPPHDPWLSGYAIAYYYFGYVMMSVMHKLTGVTAGTAYALSNAFWFALSAASAFGVVANLVLVADRSRQSSSLAQAAHSSTPLRSAQTAAVIFGVIGAIMLVLMGNFEASLEVARVSDVASPQFFQQLDILDLNQPYTAPQPGQPRWPPRFWWWWRASRVVHDYPPNTVSPQLARVTNLSPAPNDTSQELIDEFPQFSFLLGDMHPHVLALPFALLMMALALNLYIGAASGEVTSLWWMREGGSAPLWPLYALAVGGLSFLNTWDFPIYAFVLISALALCPWRAGRFNFLESVSDLVALGVTGAVLYLPFYRGFTSQAAGIAPNLYNGTRFGQFFVMFGPFLIIGAMLGVALIVSAARDKRLRWPTFIGGALGGGVGLIVALTVVMAIVSLVIMRVSKAANDLVQSKINDMAQAGISVSDHLAARLADPWVPMILGISLAAILLVWRARRETPENRSVGERPDRGVVDFALLLYAVGLLLAFGVEFAFIIDGFGTRMNTVFKFYYQAWALWSVASTFALYYLTHEADLKRVTRIGVGVVAAVVVFLGLLYPLLGIPDKVENVTPTLDALEYNGQFVPDEYAAARWFNDTITGTPVILEAPGEEYNPATSRMSTWTGLPTVVGWPVHEWQWRGNYDIQGPRVEEVKQVYSTSDMAAALATLKKYDVRYVIVGPNERRQFLPAALAKFDRNLTVAFQQGEVTVYEVP